MTETEIDILREAKTAHPEGLHVLTFAGIEDARKALARAVAIVEGPAHPGEPLKPRNWIITDNGRKLLDEYDAGAAAEDLHPPQWAHWDGR